MEGNKPAGPAAGWFKTHPSASDRLTRVKTEIAGLGAVPVKARRPDGPLRLGRQVRSLTGTGASWRTMKARAKRRKKVLRGAAVGLAVFALTILLSIAGAFRTLEWKSWDGRLKLLADPGRASADIVLLTVDQSSLDVFEKEQGARLALAAADLRRRAGFPQGRRGQGRLLRPHDDGGFDLRRRRRPAPGRRPWPAPGTSFCPSS